MLNNTMGQQSNNDQQHPRERRDRPIVDRLLESTSNPTDIQLVELARLRIRYQGFPGARQLQQDLDKLLQQWSLNEEELFARTREIHARGNVYKRGNDGEEDWS